MDKDVSTSLSIWVVYDHPSDFPDHFVARRFAGTDATQDLIKSEDINCIRKDLQERGLHCLDRHPKDDLCIMETWL